MSTPAPDADRPADDPSPERAFASRAGRKLDAALDAFGLDVRDRVAADFGCNVGGFTDCLLQRGAARVIALDTGYGTLHYRLREDPRVETRERTNALHAEPPEAGVDLVVIDMGWTKQRLAVPAALRWLRRSRVEADPAPPFPAIVTLVKPHYEVEPDERRRLVRGRLEPDAAEAVRDRVLAAMPALGTEVLGCIRSPVTGAKSGRRGRGPGNVEYLAWLRPS